MYPKDELEWQTNGESLKLDRPGDVPGVKALRKLEQEKSTRVLKLAEKFNNSKGAVIAFQKNAWNSLRSENDSEYSIEAARAGDLIGTLKGRKDPSLYCVPPTRLAGPCRGVLTKVLKNTEAWT